MMNGMRTISVPAPSGAALNAIQSGVAHGFAWREEDGQHHSHCHVVGGQIT
jgi:hypothetical protein